MGLFFIPRRSLSSRSKECILLSKSLLNSKRESLRLSVSVFEIKKKSLNSLN